MTIKNHCDRGRTTKVALSVAVLIVGLSGLLYMRGGQNRATAFTPTPAVAQLTVKQALDAWQAGADAGEIVGTKPSIVVNDVNRKLGQVLERFEILGETPFRSVGKFEGRNFVVKLELSNPKESIKTEYIVVGRDPLWVYRREDYELVMRWDHHMTKGSPNAGGIK